MKNIRNAVVRGLCLVAAGCLFTSCDVMSGPPDIQSLRESRPVGDTKELVVDLKYDVGQLDISPVSDDNLFSLDLQYDRQLYDPSFNFNAGDRANVRLDMNSRRGFGGGRERENELNLRLTDKVPLDLNLTTGVSESRLDLAGVKVRRMRLKGGVGKTEVTFDKPSGETLTSLDVESGVGELIIHGLGNTQVQRLDLKGGVGHSEIDFTGYMGGASTTEASIKVGVGAVRLKVPRDADVEIEAKGSFLSNISAPSFEHNGGNYTHRGEGGPKIRIRVESGVGGVEVEMI
jgi:hypothetical protein